MVHDDDGSGGGVRGATHELGHAIGLPHADNKCGGRRIGQIAGWEPDAQGRLQSVASARRRRPRPRAPPTPMQRPLYDLMSYCAPESSSWLSARNWTRSAVCCKRLYARLQRRGARAARAAPPLSRARAFVAGIRDARRRQHRLRRPGRPGNEAPAADPASPYIVRALDAAGAMLAEVGAPLTSASSEGGGASTFAVAIAGGTAAVELLRATVVLDRLDRSRPPTRGRARRRRTA